LSCTVMLVRQLSTKRVTLRNMVLCGSIQEH